jgi:hypothetical protein
MNHKEFLTELDKKRLHDSELLTILSEFEYTLSNGIVGEVDRAYINSVKQYAYVIEYKSLYSQKTHQKAIRQCNKDCQFIMEQFQIPKDRIFRFEAFGEANKKKKYHIYCV